MDKIESYVQSHDVTVNFPGTGAKVTLSPKSLNEDEFNVKVKLSSGARSAVEGMKSYFKRYCSQILNPKNLFLSSQIKVEENFYSASGFRSAEGHDIGSSCFGRART